LSHGSNFSAGNHRELSGSAERDGRVRGRNSRSKVAPAPTASLERLKAQIEAYRIENIER
jgi:hypothetical protein